MTIQSKSTGVSSTARHNPVDVDRITAALWHARAIRLGGDLAAIRRGLLADTQHGWTPGEIRAAVGVLCTIEMTIDPPEWMVRDLESQPMVVRVNSRGEFFLGDGVTYAPFPENTIGNNTRRAIHVFNAIRALNDAAVSIQQELVRHMPNQA